MPDARSGLVVIHGGQRNRSRDVMRGVTAGGHEMGRTYRSKPSEIEAMQYGPEFCAGLVDEVASFIAGRPVTGAEVVGFVQPGGSWDPPEDATALIQAGAGGAQGWVPVPLGHWIVRQPGDLTDHWPVDPDYFAAKYEPAEVSA